VLERVDGQLIGWNCRVEIKEGSITVDPLEEIVSGVHFNLKRAGKGRVNFHGQLTGFEASENSMFWVWK
jgi:hypothetical protein